MGRADSDYSLEMPPAEAGGIVRRLAGASMFASFHSREYRLLWFGLLFSFLGAWIQNTAMGWWVFGKAGSPFLLSLVSASGALPMLVFSLVAGAVADRFDRRRLLIITRSTVLALLALLATLVAMDVATVWHVVAISLVSGTAFAFDMPARQALIPQLVGQEQLTNAMALSSMVWNGSQIVGPAIAGSLVGWIGTANCLFVAAVMYVAILFALVAMRVPHTPPLGGRPSMMRSIADGLGLIRADSIVALLIASSGVYIVFGLPYVVFMPVFAGDVLYVGAQGLGLLLAATGIGALAGAIALAALSNTRFKGLIVFFGSVSFCVALIGFCASRWFPLSFLLLSVVGLTGSMTMTTLNALLLTRVALDFQGRVQSVLMLAWGLQPVGSMLLGGAANLVGAPLAIGIGASVCLAYTLGLAAYKSPVLKMV